MQIIVKNYAHINSSLPNWDTPRGVLVKNKDHYDRLCKESGMTPYEENIGTRKLKDYVVSEKGKEIIRQAKNSVDRKGNVKLSDRTIDAMKEIGAVHKKLPDYIKIPNQPDNGGFYNI